MTMKKLIVENLRRRFPHGHKDFLPMTLAELDLHSRKNHDYAAGGSALGNFERVAQFLKMYPKLDLSKPQNVAIVYMLKQLDAALWLESNGHVAVVEGAIERWRDVSVYAKLVAIMINEEKESKCQ